jgi:hypothetical protein
MPSPGAPHPSPPAQPAAAARTLSMSAAASSAWYPATSYRCAAPPAASASAAAGVPRRSRSASENSGADLWIFLRILMFGVWEFSAGMSAVAGVRGSNHSINFEINHPTRSSNQSNCQMVGTGIRCSPSERGAALCMERKAKKEARAKAGKEEKTE